MSPQASELTTAQLLTRAKAAVACGDHLGAIAAALVAIAETGVAQQTPVKPARRTTKILREAERTTSWIWHNPEFPHGGACVYTWLGDAWYYCAIGDGTYKWLKAGIGKGGEITAINGEFVEVTP